MLRQFFAVVIIALSTQITASPISSYNYSSVDGENAAAINTTESSVLNVTSIQDFLLNSTLTEKIASQESEASTHTYQFHDFGVVDIIGENTKGELTINTLFWDIEESPDGISIILVDPPTGLNFEFEVNALRDGSLTVNFEGKTLKFNTNTPLPEETISLMESQISGTWGTNAYPFDVVDDINRCGAFEEMNGAYLSYRFNLDGTYSKMAGSAMVAIQEAGVWEVTKDGQYVIFYSAIEGNPEDVTDIQIAKIKSISNESLVLGQALKVPKSDFDTLFCTITKDFELNKADATSNLR